LAESETLEADDLYRLKKYKRMWFGNAREFLDRGSSVCVIRLTYLTTGANDLFVVTFYIAAPMYRVLGSEQSWLSGY